MSGGWKQMCPGEPKLVRLLAQYEHVNRKSYYFENWHSCSYMNSMDLNTHIYHNDLKIVFHSLKINFGYITFNRSSSFTKDLFHFSQKRNTSFSKIKPYFSRLSPMSISSKEYFPFGMLVFGQCRLELLPSQRCSPGGSCTSSGHRSSWGSPRHSPAWQPHVARLSRMCGAPEAVTVRVGRAVVGVRALLVLQPPTVDKGRPR